MQNMFNYSPYALSVSLSLSLLGEVSSSALISFQMLRIICWRNCWITRMTLSKLSFNSEYLLLEWQPLIKQLLKMNVLICCLSTWSNKCVDSIRYGFLSLPLSHINIRSSDQPICFINLGWYITKSTHTHTWKARHFICYMFIIIIIFLKKFKSIFISRPHFETIHKSHSTPKWRSEICCALPLMLQHLCSVKRILFQFRIVIDVCLCANMEKSYT